MGMGTDVRVFDDLRALQYAGNEGAHASGRVRGYFAQSCMDEVFERILRMSACLVVWCRLVIRLGMPGKSQHRLALGSRL